MFGSVYLSDALTLRDTLRYLAPGLTAGMRLSSDVGAASLLGGRGDFYPSLVFDPCGLAVCTGYRPSRGNTSTRVALQAESAGAAGLLGAYGVKGAPASDSGEADSLAWSYWGAEVFRSFQDARVWHDGNTVLDHSDDRVERVNNSDWSRQAASHVGVWAWPRFATKGQVSVFVSEVDEGLGAVVDKNKGSPRSFGRLGILEARTESLLPSDGGRLALELRGYHHDRWDTDQVALWSGSTIQRGANFWSGGMNIETPRSDGGGLRQVRLGWDLESVSVGRTETLVQEQGSFTSESWSELRPMLFGGLAFGLGSWQDVDLEWGLGARFSAAHSRSSSQCPITLRNQGLCSFSGYSYEAAPPSFGMSLSATKDDIHWQGYAEATGRRPDLLERRGGAFGVRANEDLLAEERLAWGVRMGLPMLQMRWEQAHESKGITLERMQGGGVRFVNDDPVKFQQLALRAQQPAFRPSGGSGDSGDWHVEHRMTWASRVRGPNRGLPGVPRHHVEALVASPMLRVYQKGVSRFRIRGYARANWRDAIYLDRENLISEDALWVAEPGVSLRLDQEEQDFELEVGTRLAGRGGDRVDRGWGPAALPRFTERSAEEWGSSSMERLALVLRLRGHF
jgi:hypothetical protein